MKKHILVALILLFKVTCYAQIAFEKGYFITNEGERVACLIRNMDWKNNPTKFEYRVAEDAAIQTHTIDSIKQFGVAGEFQFNRFVVQMDRSSNEISKLSASRNPEFQTDTLFLKVLVQGRASLYGYEEGNLKRYFYTIDSSDPVQLVYKSFRAGDNQIEKNLTYQQQLWVDLPCEGLKIQDAKSTGYNKNDLIKFFVKYNACIQSDFVKFREEQDLGNSLNISLRPGLNYGTLSIVNTLAKERNVAFGSKLGLRVGAEAEFIMPYNKKKWGIILEPTYLYFHVQEEQKDQSVDLNYKSVELPLGLRHYFYLNNNSKVFINASFVLAFDLNSQVKYRRYNVHEALDVYPGRCLAFGLGYTYNQQYSLEFRSHTKRNLLTNYAFWEADYSNMSLILGYTLF